MTASTSGRLWNASRFFLKTVSAHDDARVWLRENGYADVADLIDETMAVWGATGKQTRRNWWWVLAGSKDGRPRVIGGRVFPVLKAARARQGLPVTSNAISRNDSEKAPPVRPNGRWPKRSRPGGGRRRR